MDPSNVVDTMSTQAWLALIIPIVFTTLIGPWLAYKYAVKTADRKAKADKELAAQQAADNAKTEGRRMDLAEWQAMTADLRQEIERLRHARDADDRKMQSMEDEMADLESEVRVHRSSCVADVARLQAQLGALTDWERQVWKALSDPGVYRILESAGFRLPAPPILPLVGGATAVRAESA